MSAKLPIAVVDDGRQVRSSGGDTPTHTRWLLLIARATRPRHGTERRGRGKESKERPRHDFG
jgi:hypothetical protein